MSTIKVKVTDQLAEFVDTPPIAAGDVNVDAVQFDLSNEWKSGYELMAVFWRADSKTRYTCLLDENYIATVPSEVMKSEGIVVFGVCGISTSKTLTSSTLSYTILDGAVVKFDTANVDIYDELIKLFKNTKITSGQITSNGHLVFKKVDGTTVDVGSGISLTTQQVNTAFKEFIEDYAEEMDYTKVNIAVITRLKEIHKNGIIQFWAGTKAEYEAITPADNVFYIITDEDQDELIADDNGWTVQKFATGFLIAKYNSKLTIAEGNLLLDDADRVTLPTDVIFKQLDDIVLNVIPWNTVYNAKASMSVNGRQISLIRKEYEEEGSYMLSIIGRWK